MLVADTPLLCVHYKFHLRSKQERVSTSLYRAMENERSNPLTGIQITEAKKTNLEEAECYSRDCFELRTEHIFFNQSLVSL